MLATPRHRNWEKRPPTTKRLEGLTLETVRLIEARARRLAQHPDAGQRAEFRWRQWYNVCLQMTMDGITVCPSEYRWEPESLTC